MKTGLSTIDYDPELWNYLGTAYWKKGDYDNAYKAYQKALSLDDNYPIVFNNLGSLYLSQYIKTKDDRYFWNTILNSERPWSSTPIRPFMVIESAKSKTV